MKEKIHAFIRTYEIINNILSVIGIVSGIVSSLMILDLFGQGHPYAFICVGSATIVSIISAITGIVHLHWLRKVVA